MTITNQSDSGSLPHHCLGAWEIEDFHFFRNLASFLSHSGIPYKSHTFQNGDTVFFGKDNQNP